MTPRALLTAIGATAIAFAIAIGNAAGTESSSEAPVIASTTTHMSAPAHPEGPRFTLLANQDCPFTV